MKTMFTGVVYNYDRMHQFVEIWVSDERSYHVEVHGFIIVQEHNTDTEPFHVVTVFGLDVSDNVLKSKEGQYE